MTAKLIIVFYNDCGIEGSVSNNSKTESSLLL